MAYTVTAITGRIQRRVRDTSFSASAIMDYMNDVQRDVSNEYVLRFWEKGSPQTYTLVTDNREITDDVGLPADFVMPISLFCVTAGYKYEIPFIDYKEFEAEHPDPDSETAGSPSSAYVYAQSIYVDRLPDQAYTVRLKYQRRPTELTSGDDVPEIPAEFEELFHYGVGARIFEEKDMDDKAATWAAKAELIKQKIVTRYSDRVLNQPLQMKVNRAPAYRDYPGGLWRR